MAIGVIFHFQGATNEQYDEVTRALNNEHQCARWPTGPGRYFSHAAAQRRTGR